MAGVYSFGEFEVDEVAYELRCASGVVKLERLPMDALIRLVAARGALVTRQELRVALWPTDVFIDEDAAINTVIRKIRRALGDDAETPRFVETVVGKGYRFLAPVETTGRSESPAPALETAEVGPIARGQYRVAIVAVGVLLVSGALVVRVWPAVASGSPLSVSVDPAAGPRPVLPAAYEAYVRGRYAWNKRTEPDLRAAIQLFQKSLDADPTYAPAYVGLSDSYAQLGYGSYVKPEDAFPPAREAARRAIELDSSLADAHAALGYALMYYDWDFQGAGDEFSRAIALAPNKALGHQWRAYLLTATERPLAEAEHEIAEARRLDPLSVAINTDRAYILHYYGRNAEALDAARLALEMQPAFPLAHFWLGRIQTQERRYADAHASFERIGPLRTWTPAMAALGYLEARSGHPDAARGMLEAFEQLRRNGHYASTYAMAVVYAGLRDRDHVFALLDDAVRERSHWLVWLKRDPRWDFVRNDPRFADLVRRVGLPADAGQLLKSSD